MRNITQVKVPTTEALELCLVLPSGDEQTAYLEHDENDRCWKLVIDSRVSDDPSALLTINDGDGELHLARG